MLELFQHINKKVEVYFLCDGLLQARCILKLRHFGIPDVCCQEFRTLNSEYLLVNLYCYTEIGTYTKVALVLYILVVVNFQILPVSCVTNSLCFRIMFILLLHKLLVVLFVYCVDRWNARSTKVLCHISTWKLFCEYLLYLYSCE